jgi:hypothetical protein
MRFQQIALYVLVVALAVTGITLLIPPEQSATRSCKSPCQMVAGLSADRAHRFSEVFRN